MNRANSDLMGMLGPSSTPWRCKTPSRPTVDRRAYSRDRMDSGEPTSAARRATPRKGRVVIFAAGMGNPISRPTRRRPTRAEIEADIVLKGTHAVDGVYSRSAVNPKPPIQELSFDEVISRDLRVMI